ncbi:Nucleoredoxin, partial [Thalictrum thalictroides]
VKITELSGKNIALYFSASWCGPCHQFTPELTEAYNQLSPKNDFEVVYVTTDQNEESFNDYFSKMPWLAIPFSDSETSKHLNELFDVKWIPYLVILSGNGKVLTDKGVDIISKYAAGAYPFTPERIQELEQAEERANQEQTLSSLLVSPSSNFVPVSELDGKNILLYFSAHWCPPCRAFLPKLIEAYHEIKAKDDAFEVVFISSDRDELSFQEFFSSMPWLALPYGDEQKSSLSKTFKIGGIPTVIALGPFGKTVKTDAKEILMAYGANAYPFTNEHLIEMAKEWPEKELSGTSFYCEECDFDLHPKCALVEVDKETKDEEKNCEDGSDQADKKEWICDGGKSVTKLELFSSLLMSETEAPFRPREKLLERQRFFQNIHKHTYLKGPMDKITSVAIPLGLALTCGTLIARGIYNMSHGIGKKE